MYPGLALAVLSRFPIPPPPAARVPRASASPHNRQQQTHAQAVTAFCLFVFQILVETRGLQKDLGMLGGKIERTFTVAEEEIFKESKTNPAARLAYKHLANLHAQCGDLIEVVRKTGAVAREIRDLEDQVNHTRERVRELRTATREGAGGCVWGCVGGVDVCVRACTC